jgi:hypothetical protein
MHSFHPSHDIVKIPPGPRTNKSGRPLKETLSSRFGDKVAPYLQDGVLLDINYKKTKDALHAFAVTNYFQSADPNALLGVEPPPVNPSESSLPRAYQTMLCQLRSKRCASLKLYLHFIKKADNDLCPACFTAPHTTPHLFTCPSYPTTLSLLDLWYQPMEVAELLSTLPPFDHLPLSIPPTPLPPPEPPP